MASRDNARRFHFLREIASGGFGTVFLCKVVHADGFSRLAAVKVLKAQWSDSDEVVRRIRDEARLLGMLRHRHIISVSDLTSIDGRAAVVMELVEGVDLRAVVRHLTEQAEAIPVRAALDITAAVASALDAAYNRPPLPGDKPLRVIHRDIKPSNVMVDRQGEVKVLDFGVAQSELVGRESHTEELQFGSVDYMAPERLFFEPETPAGDVYALGATLFELLAHEKLGKARGRPDQHAASVEDRLSFLRACLPLRGTVATELTDLIRSMVSFEHERRPSAADVHQHCRALGRLVDGEELQPWAERLIPLLIEEAAKEPLPPTGLADTVCTEDSVSRGFLSDADAAGPELGARLRQGALRELEDSSGRLAPAAPAPAAPLAAPGLAPTDLPPASRTLAPDLSDPGLFAPDIDGPDEWNDLPTVVGQLGDPTETLDPRSEALRPPVPIASPAEPRALPPRPEPPPTRSEAPSAASPSAAPPPTGFPVTGAPVAPPRPTPDPFPDELEATVVVPDETTGVTGPLAEPAAPPPRGGNRLVPIIIGGLVGGCLLTVVAGIIVIAVAFVVMRPELPPEALALPEIEEPEVGVPAEAPEEAPELAEAAPEPVEAAPAEAAPELAAAPAGGGILFRSLDGDTRKLNVRCAEGNASGSDQARLERWAAERCVVTAVNADRSRRVAVVDQAETGEYACFAGSEDGCERR